MTDTYQPSLFGFPLEIEIIDDGFEKSIAQYEFPYRDGALLEDMGQKARTVKFRCFFYNETYADHLNFLDALSVQDLTEFTHPKYGIIEGCVKTVAVHADERQQTAQIDVTFVENLGGYVSPQVYEDVQASAEEDFIQGQSDMTDDVTNDMQTALGPESTYVAGVTLDPTQPLLSQFTGLSQKATAYVAQVQNSLNTLNGLQSQITNPVNSLVGTTSFDTNLPGLVVGTIAKAAERCAIAASYSSNLPSGMVTGAVSS